MTYLTKRISLLAVLVFAFPGCQGELRPDGMPKLHPCTITITQEGKPLEMALVSLVAEDEDLSQWATGGFTDQDGKCVPHVRGKFRGVPAGKFKVMVSKTETEESKMGNAPPEELSASEKEKWWDRRYAEKIKSFQRVAEKYMMPATTDLEIEVLPKTNVFTFDVGAPTNIVVPD